MVKELKIERNVPKHTAVFTICMSLGIPRETINKLFKKKLLSFKAVWTFHNNEKAVNIRYNSLMEKCARVFL